MNAKLSNFIFGTGTGTGIPEILFLVPYYFVSMISD
jgi:hypothetical protein